MRATQALVVIITILIIAATVVPVFFVDGAIASFGSATVVISIAIAVGVGLGRDALALPMARKSTTCHPENSDRKSFLGRIVI